MFNFGSKSARMGRISSNLEKHGEEFVKAFDIPLTVMLAAEEVDDLVGAGAAKAFFVQKDGVKELAALSTHSAPFTFDENFDQATIDLRLAGDAELQYAECKVSNLVLTPKVGGLTETKFSVRVRPDGDECLALLEQQMREVHIAISNSKVALKKSPKQAELNLGEGSDAEEVDEEKPKGKGRKGKRGNGEHAATH